MEYFFLFVIALWLAYSNGANDNFKGVATIYGSGTASYQQALLWASFATVAGSLTSVFLAEQLIKVFSGAWILPAEILGSSTMLISVGLSAAMTIFFATLMGMPTSTTHALTGALIGVAWIASSSNHFATLFLKIYMAPLLLSPLIAIVMTGSLYPLFQWFRTTVGITKETCVCLTEGTLTLDRGSRSTANLSVNVPELHVNQVQICRQTYGGSLIGVQAKTFVDTIHYMSAGAVCFSRALNDTPKIAALLLSIEASNLYLDKQNTLIFLAIAMTIGGLIQSRRVAETMSRRITNLNPGQGLTANLVTAALVLFASRFGIPVSTTHVSCGSIFGIALVQREADWKIILSILLAWITTLPLAAVISAMLYTFLL